MLDQIKEIFEENDNIDSNTKLKDLVMDSINVLSVYLLFKNNNKEITFDEIKSFDTIGDILNAYDNR